MTSRTLPRTHMPVASGTQPLDSREAARRYSYLRKADRDPLGTREPVLTEGAAGDLAGLPEDARAVVEESLRQWSKWTALRSHWFPRDRRLLWSWRVLRGVEVERARKAGDYAVVHVVGAQQALICRIEPWSWARSLAGTFAIWVTRQVFFALLATLLVGIAIASGVRDSRVGGALILFPIAILPIRAARDAVRWIGTRRQEIVAELETCWRGLGLHEKGALRFEEYATHQALADGTLGALGPLAGAVVFAGFLLSAWKNLQPQGLGEFAGVFLALLLCWLVAVAVLSFPLLIPSALPRGYRSAGAVTAVTLVLATWGIVGTVLANSGEDRYLPILGEWLQWSAVSLPVFAVLAVLLRKLCTVMTAFAFPAETIASELLKAAEISGSSQALRLEERREQRKHLETASRTIETALPFHLALDAAQVTGMRRIAHQVRARILWTIYPDEHTDTNFRRWVAKAVGHIAKGHYHYLQEGEQLSVPSRKTGVLPMLLVLVAAVLCVVLFWPSMLVALGTMRDALTQVRELILIVATSGGALLAIAKLRKIRQDQS